MPDPAFTCPVCGGHYFSRDAKRINGDFVVLDTVHCDGDGSDMPYRKCWRGVWPEPPSDAELDAATFDDGVGA